MIDDLKKTCELEENFDLKKYNTLRLNSTCKVILFPNNVQEIKKVLNILKKYKSKYFIIGNGSNIILPSFYDGVVIKLSKLTNYKIEKNNVFVEAGCMINKLASVLVEKGLAGLDFASGIPGTIGGSIYGNAGCFGSSISASLVDVTIYDGNNIRTLKNEELKFDYRYSIFKEHKNWIILSANFKVSKCNKEELKELVLERTKKRVSSQDLKNPSNGSMFKNPEGYSAGKLIDDLGLKGFCFIVAMVSLKHANFIINKGNATCEDILKLVDIIKQKVKEEYNIDLKMEQEIIK